MNDRPAPEPRYPDADHQAAYETGWRQMYDHDSFRVLDWVDVAVDDVADEAERCRRRAAMLEGAADALFELADAQCAFAADLDGSDAA